MKDKKKIARLLDKQRNISKRGLSPQYENTIACQSFYNGDMMNYTDRIQFMDTVGRRKRASVNFNKIQSNVDSVVGFMAQNRRQAKYIARVNADQGQQLYSKNMNALYEYHRENCNADQLETEQDADMLISGYGATETDLSYIIGNSTTLPNGEMIKVKIDPKSVGWDPSAKGKNLLDSRWAYYFEDYELQDALDLFQSSKAEDFEKVSDDSPGDAGYVYNPWGGLYDKIKLEDTVEWSAKEQDMVRVYNHQWFEYQTFYRAMNPLWQAVDPQDALFIKARLDIIQADIEDQYGEEIISEDMFKFDPREEELVFDEKVKNILKKEFGDLIEPIPFKRKCFYTAVVSGDHIFTVFKSICQQGFSIKFKTGIYNEQGKFWTGMVNSMMEPQKYYNKALTELMFTIASMSKGGVMVEEGAVEDVTDFSAKWAKTDAVIKVNAGALSGGMIQEKARAALPTGLENIITLSDSAISATGVDPAFLGNISEEQSGVLYKRRIRQVISKMARYFDSGTLYQKEDARLCADLIRVWVENNNGKWVRITGSQGEDEFAVISQDMLYPEYDVTIQEAPQTPEDKHEVALVLGQYGDKLIMTDPNAAKAFYAESLQQLPLDGDAKNRLVRILMPQDDMVPMAQYQQLQQMVEQLQGKLTQAQVRNLEADAAYKEAGIQERNAKTVATLEEAANKGLENDIIRQNGYEKATVTI
jgi:hypothetical protein